MKNALGYLGIAGFFLLTSCEACNEPIPEVNSEIRWANDVTVFETSLLSSIDVEVRINPANTREVSVEYATIEGTALAVEDFVAASGSVTFSPGETSKKITIQVVTDEYLEPDETFQVELKNPVNGYIKIGEPRVDVGLRNDDTNILFQTKATTRHRHMKE